MYFVSGGFLDMASSTSSKGNNMMRLKQENQSLIRKIIYPGTCTALFYCRRSASNTSYYYNKCGIAMLQSRYFI